MRAKQLVVAIIISIQILTSAPYDWFEGTQEKDNGATRDFYNRAATLPWKNIMGDWHDREGTAQGNKAYAVTTIEDTDSPRAEQWDVTELVSQWIDGTHINKGMLLRMVDGYQTKFYSKEHPINEERPMLILHSATGIDTLSPTDDTYIGSSTYQGFGDSELLSVMDTRGHVLLKFDIPDNESISKAILQLFTHEQYGTNSVGVFRLSQGDELDESAPRLGIAANFTNDEGLNTHESVLFATGFEKDSWVSEWSAVTHTPKYVTQITDADAEKFKPLSGKAVRVRLGTGDNYGGSLNYNFEKKTGTEPEEIYWRYYLRLSDNWDPTITGGKLPGISGTYGRAGWGGRPSDGTNGWSARGSFHTAMHDNPPFGERRNTLGFYCYHADMDGSYGDVWNWTKGYNGYLANNRWYCIEQYCKMNTPGENDGILRAWVDGRLAFEKTDIKMRTVDSLKIYEIWMNVYHGGKAAAPNDMDLYFDNVVIAREYIGPMSSDISIIKSNSAKSKDTALQLVMQKGQLLFPEGWATLFSLNGRELISGTSPIPLPSNGVYLIRHSSLDGIISTGKIVLTQ